MGKWDGANGGGKMRFHLGCPILAPAMHGSVYVKCELGNTKIQGLPRVLLEEWILVLADLGIGIIQGLGGGSRHTLCSSQL